MFINIDAFSSEGEFVCGDAVKVVKWIKCEVEAFDEVLTSRGDFCSCVSAWRIVSLLEKAGCDHVKSVILPDFKVSVSDINDPSAKAVELGRKFYADLAYWWEEDESARDNTGKVSFDHLICSFSFLYCNIHI
jgi:hypothetical protein